MKRPQRVDEALFYDEQSCCWGAYGPYQLQSAYQPIFRIDRSRATASGFEGLVRPFQSGKSISPVEFFPLVDQEDRFFIEWMCRALHLRNFCHLNRPNSLLFLNLDPSLYDSEEKAIFEIDYMINRLHRSNLKPANIICEIIESKASSLAVLKAIVEHFSNNGIRVAIDDFGMEHSNIERMHEIEPDFVKLDRLWFQKQLEHRSTTRLLEILIEQMENQGINVIFEGVEDENQLSFVQSSISGLAQGFLLGHPNIVPVSFNNIEKPVSRRLETMKKATAA